MFKNNTPIVNIIIKNLGHDEQHKDTDVHKWLRRDHWDQYHMDKISENYHWLML